MICLFTKWIWKYLTDLDNAAIKHITYNHEEESGDKIPNTMIKLLWYKKVNVKYSHII